ncbi:hypothetical protein V2G26_006535 [Clonostachys chloroleuca]
MVSSSLISGARGLKEVKPGRHQPYNNDKRLVILVYSLYVQKYILYEETPPSITRSKPMALVQLSPLCDLTCSIQTKLVFPLLQNAISQHVQTGVGLGPRNWECYD